MVLVSQGLEPGRSSSSSSLESEVELGGAGVVRAKHQHAFSREILEVGIPGDFEESAPTPSSRSSESMGEEPAVTRSVSLLQGGSGQYGASTCPLTPGKVVA